MLSMRRFAVLAVILVAVLAPAGTASAKSPGCYGASCDGGYAASLGCGTGAYAIAGFSVTNGGGIANSDGYLWYSPACHAAWGEYSTPTNADARRIYLYSQPFNGGAYEDIEFADVVHLGFTTTTMTNWDSSLKFCAHYGQDPNFDQSPGSNVRCTRWR